MPPKRPVSAGASASQAKAAKTTATTAGAGASTDAELSAEAAPKIVNRWSKVSVSRNLYAAETKRLAEPNAYEFKTTCTPSFERPEREDDGWETEEEYGSEDDFYRISDDDEDDDEGDNEDEDGSENMQESFAPEASTSATREPDCDDGKTCMCNKTPAEHPDHPWVLTVAGDQKLTDQFIHAGLRDPDRWSSYTWNDHRTMGLVQILQNLLLDYDEGRAERWQRQWIVVEAAIMFLMDRECAALDMYPDGDELSEILALFGRMILDMVARLGREGTVSEVTNVGSIMALYAVFANEAYGNLYVADDSKTQGDGFEFRLLGDFILEYARTLNIALRGPKDLGKVIAEDQNYVAVPEPTAARDPWGFQLKMDKYKDDYRIVDGSRPGEYSGVGGDSLDVTSWTVAERKSHSFSGKDMLDKATVAAIKKGEIVHIG